MTQHEKIREAVAAFDDPQKIEKAVSELEVKEFPRQSINVLGNKEKVAERFGAKAVDPEWLEDHPSAPRAAPVRPQERTLGSGLLVTVPAYIGGCIGLLATNPAPTATLLGGVAIGSIIGAAIGAGVLTFIRFKRKDSIKRQLGKGGLLLWVATPDRDKEKTAIKILRKNGGHHVHLHSIA